MSNFEFELAKDGNYTMKYLNKYIYSKYKPKLTLEELGYSYDNGYYLFLGVGLGYEILDLIDNGINLKKIIVFDSEKENINFLKKKSKQEWEKIESNVELIYDSSNDNIYNDNKLELFTIIINTKLIMIDERFYKEILYNIKSSIGNLIDILVVEHPTIMRDCISAFKNLGFSVYELSLGSKDNILEISKKLRPKFIFSINILPGLSKISSIMSIPYIAWAVDTPCYTLYDKRNNSDLQYNFIYDSEIVDRLRSMGVDNNEYMPVAANTHRMKEFYNIVNQKYISDISFLGNTVFHNEISNNILNIVGERTKNIINELINIQEKNISEYVLRDIVDEDMVKMIELESSFKFKDKDYLERKEILAYLIGRYHSYLQRTHYIGQLSNKYNIKVYGDDKWLDYIDGDIYGGYAEHYKDMPKVFNSSKININITRSFVENGMPMRIFDVLGSGGFLLTNANEDLKKYFKDGIHCVYYNSYEDLENKINYYLEHPIERENIRINGYKEVSQYHTYDIRIAEILKAAEEYFLTKGVNLLN